MTTTAGGGHLEDSGNQLTHTNENENINLTCSNHVPIHCSSTAHDSFTSELVLLNVETGRESNPA